MARSMESRTGAASFESAILRKRESLRLCFLLAGLADPARTAYKVGMNPCRMFLVFSCTLLLSWSGCSKKPPSISLHQAVETGNLKAVQQHIAAKSDLNKLDTAGWTPLHLATLKGNLPIVQALSAGGADLNCVSKYGKTPLDLARAKNLPTIVQFLEQQTQKKGGGRGLIDGGLGVSDAMNNL